MTHKNDEVSKTLSLTIAAAHFNLESASYTSTRDSKATGQTAPDQESLRESWRHRSFQWWPALGIAGRSFRLSEPQKKKKKKKKKKILKKNQSYLIMEKFQILVKVTLGRHCKGGEGRGHDAHPTPDSQSELEIQFLPLNQAGPLLVL